MSARPTDAPPTSELVRGLSGGALDGVIRDLRRLGWHARWLIVSRRGIGILAAVAAVSTVAIILDWIFRFPAPFRLVLLVAGIAALAVAARRLLLPALRFRPSPTELALRIERSSPALKGRLASGVEFALSGADRDSSLAARAVSDLAARLAGESIRSWLAPRRSFAELSTALMTLVAIAALAAFLPKHASIGATRLFVPFAKAEWPARTHVESLMPPQEHHAKGQPLLLSARLTQGDGASERVVALLDVERDDGTTSSDRLVLTRQRDGRYERVLEGDPTVASVDVRFASVDHESDAHTITMVAPPAIVSATLELTPPAYASAGGGPKIVDVGDGTDERAIVREPALVGSTARLSLEMNKALAPRGDPEAWASRMLAGDPEPPMLEVQAEDATRWELRWTVTGPREIRLTPEDELGIRAVDEILFRVDAVEDRPPVCAVTAPATDESVLSTALVPAAIEARDDVGLVLAGLTVTRSDGAKGEPIPVLDEVRPEVGTLVRHEQAIDVASLGAAPGDTLTLQAVAEDGFVLGDERHDRTRSAPRLLRVISEVEFGKQIRTQLGSVRRAAVRLDAQQAELSAAALNGRFDPTLERGQGQVSQRLRDAGEAIDALSERVGRNRLDDEELIATLDQARELVGSAGRNSARASEAMQQRREATSDEDAQRAADQATVAQEDVREDLEDLIRLLDRDEDSWAMGREIERLREVVERLMRRTSDVGERTVGQSPEDLDENDRAELEAIGSEQRDSARAAQELIDELRKRAEAVDRVDKSRANAMREAARAGEERRLQRNLEQAGDEVRQNRMQQAQQAQSAALDALDQMRRGLDDVRKARAEELRRALESLEQSIERLIRTNEDELIGLAQVTGPDDEERLGERGRAMVKLAQNTQAVAGEARAIGSEAGRIARTLERAADNHGAAVGFLRAKPARLTDAKSAEERGLELLNEALESARQAREQSEAREQARKLQEIVATYRQQLEQQQNIRDVTLLTRPREPGGRLDRRGLIESRRLSVAQGDVGRSIARMLEEHGELAESEVFVEAHGLVSDWASRASDRLGRGELDDETVSLETQIVDTLQGLVDSLAQGAPDDNPFQESQSSSGGGGQPQSQDQSRLPPIAELKLIRGLQVQVLERTRRLDGARAEGTDSPDLQAQLDALSRLQERMVGLLEGIIRKQQAPPEPPSDDSPPVPEAPSATSREPTGIREREPRSESISDLGREPPSVGKRLRTSAGG